MKNYTWEYSQEEEIWRHDTFDTIEECVADAKENYGLSNGSVFVGECVLFDTYVNAYDVLEQLKQDAFDFAGECAEGWDLFVNMAEVDELSESLTEVVKNWLKKYNREPSFYSVGNIRVIEV